MLKKISLVVMLGLSTQSIAADDNYLFFQTASHGSLKKVDKNQYILTLDNPPEVVNYFTERPSRKSGIFKVKEFLALWNNKDKNAFANNPPNAAITMVTVKGDYTQDVIAAISEPTLANHRISYRLNPIEGKEIKTGNLKHVVLFFDSIPWNSGGF